MIEGPDRGSKGVSPEPQVSKVNHFSIDEIIRKTSNASERNPNALASNPNRAAIESLRKGVQLASNAHKSDVYPKFEYATQPHAEGMTVEGDTKVIYVSESVLEGLPFLERGIKQAIEASQTSIGQGGQRERNFVLNGENPFRVSLDTITVIRESITSTSPANPKPQAA